MDAAQLNESNWRDCAVRWHDDSVASYVSTWVLRVDAGLELTTWIACVSDDARITGETCSYPSLEDALSRAHSWHDGASDARLVTKPAFDIT